MPDLPAEANNAGYIKRSGGCGIHYIAVDEVGLPVGTVLTCHRRKNHEGNDLDVDHDVWFGQKADGSWLVFPRSRQVEKRYSKKPGTPKRMVT